MDLGNNEGAYLPFFKQQKPITTTILLVMLIKDEMT
jgi:hypothetical protein